jgi:hypothetical protein
MSKFFIEENEEIPATYYGEIRLDGYVEITDPYELSKLFLNRELNSKRNRKEYGQLLHEIVASQFRLARLQLDTSLAAHAAQRALTYTNFKSLQDNIENGNFISAYEDIEGLTVGMGLTAPQIVLYRRVIASYLTSISGVFTDVFGNSVVGGAYEELQGKAVDENWYIIES